MTADKPGTLTVRLRIDITEFEAAMRGVARTARSAAADLQALRKAEAAHRRRQRRYSTHVIETCRGSAMHAAYRAKTKRRNRR